MKLSPLFTDHMVFQANKPLRIFGTGRGDVFVEIAGNFSKFTSTSDKWCFELPPLVYGGPYTLNITLNEKRISLSDVYIGEVLLLAGQSNIEFTLAESSYPKDKYVSNSLIRCFGFERIERENHFVEEDGWVVCNDENLPYWSAIGYHLGARILAEKGIAVGMFFCYHGTSVIESWIPEELAREDRFYLPVEEKNYNNGFHQVIKVHMVWNEYGMLYNRMQQKIAPFTIGNVIWYQGESNTGSGEWKKYTDLLKALIECWREDFKDSDMPFIVVQIADFDERKDEGWLGIQKAQLAIRGKISNTVVVVSADVCESDNIHPKTKIELANRIFDHLK